jgi:hypothetical protein
LIHGISAFGYTPKGASAPTHRIDLAEVALSVLANHADSPMSVSAAALSDGLATALKAFFVATSSSYRVEIYFAIVGYDETGPWFHLVQSVGNANATRMPIQIKPFRLIHGIAIPLGEAALAKEILSARTKRVTGRDRRLLNRFLTTQAATTSDEMLRIFEVCLEATEQDRELGKGVQPPNRFAVIRPDTGFSFIERTA